MSTLTLEIGATVRVPFNLRSQTIEVDCVLIDQRRVYNRVEWLILPIKGGDTPAWVRETTLLGDNKGTTVN